MNVSYDDEIAFDDRELINQYESSETSSVSDDTKSSDEEISNEGFSDKQ